MIGIISLLASLPHAVIRVAQKKLRKLFGLCALAPPLLLNGVNVNQF